MHGKIIAKHAHVTGQDLPWVLVTDQSHINIAWCTKERRSLPQNMITCLNMTFSWKTLLTVLATAKGTSDVNLWATEYSQLAT